MQENERLSRLDELAQYEIWCQKNDPENYMQYLRERSLALSALADHNSMGKGRAKKIHATRASLIELLATLQNIGYSNQDLAKFHIDIIVYRVEAIWKSVKKK